MSQLLANVLSILIMVPFIAYVLVFIAVKLLTGNHKRAVRLAIDSTTFFLFICLQFMIAEIWSGAFIWFFYIGFFVIAIIFSLFHWRKHDEIHYSQLFKGVWRVNFLIFFVMYFGFMLYGLTTSVIKAMS